MAPTTRIDETGDDDGVESADLRVPDCAHPFRVSHGAAHSRGACESLTGLSGCRKNIEQGAAFSDMGYGFGPNTTVCSPVRAQRHIMDEEPSIQRRLAAILAADIAGYSRLMHEDEAATVRDLKAHQSVILPLIGRHGGRVIDTAGDGILAEFPSVIGATECAVQIQTVMAERSAGVPEHRRMRLRVGINLGDVIHDDARIYGDGINIAARLETLAEPGGVLVSGTVYDHVR